MSILARVARNSFNGKSTVKIDIGSLKSLHALFDTYLDHMLVIFEQNRIVRIIQNCVLFDKKWLTILNKVLTPFGRRFCD